MSTFDPYHKWLDIPPEEQPPHHYRLLGINTFESDREVIRNAADQRMTYLKTFVGGQHSELSQELLNEVSAAKVCLLDDAKKREYDNGLRQRAAPLRTAPQAPLVAVKPVQTVPRTDPAPFKPVTPGRPSRHFRRRVRGSDIPKTVIHIAVSILLFSILAGERRELFIPTRDVVNPVAGAWTSVSIPLDTSAGWRKFSDDTDSEILADEDEIRAVLGNLVGLRIPGEFSTTRDNGCLDNVVFGME